MTSLLRSTQLHLEACCAIINSLTFRRNWLACWLWEPRSQVRISLSTDIFLLLSKISESRRSYCSAVKMPAVEVSWNFFFVTKVGKNFLLFIFLVNFNVVFARDISQLHVKFFVFYSMLIALRTPVVTKMQLRRLQRSHVVLCSSYSICTQWYSWKYEQNGRSTARICAADQPYAKKFTEATKGISVFNFSAMKCVCVSHLWRLLIKLLTWADRYAERGRESALENDSKRARER